MHITVATAMLMGRLLVGQDTAAPESAPTLLPQPTVTVMHFPPPDAVAAPEEPAVTQPAPCQCQAPAMNVAPAAPLSNGLWLATGSSWWMVGAPPLFLDQSLDSIPQGGPVPRYSTRYGVPDPGPLW